jgi:hypothetical protein
MRRRFALDVGVALGLALGLALGSALGPPLGLWSEAGAQLWDRILEGYKGPYRGRVVDAETGEPIAGAVALAIWDREKMYPLHSRDVFHAAREVLTAADGTFTLDAKDVEGAAPPRTVKPYFEIYAPGYAAYGSRLYFARGGFQRGGQWFLGGGPVIVIGLPRLKTREDRIQGLNQLLPAAPWELMPEYLRLINVERTALGLKPLGQPKETK